MMDYDKYKNQATWPNAKDYTTAVGLDMAKACVEAFLATPFAGDRHVRRVEKLSRTPQDA